MDWLFFILSTLSGVTAGLLSWSIHRSGNPWDLIGNFQASLFTSSIFCGFFAGLVFALPVLVKEKRFKKSLNYFVSAFVVSFSINALGSVIYSILMESLINKGSNLPISVLRFFWWLLLSVGLSCSFGFLHGNINSLCRAQIGLTPAFIIAGALTDKMFLAEGQFMFSIIFMGGILGIGYAISQELLKEAWIEEYRGYGILFRYYLNETEFSAGSSEECDLTIDSGAEVLFVINFKDSVHVFESQTKDLEANINNSKFRYRALVDGDKIRTENRTFVYRSSFSRIREELPQFN